MKTQKSLLLALVALLGIILVWVLFFWSPTASKSQEHQNLALTATPVGGDFTVDVLDKKLSLNELQGKVVVLYFGYTQCPDICPTSLALLTQALHQLDDKEIGGIQSMFVSVDPDRDTTAKLDEYTKYFHKNILGGTSTKENIDKITKLYGASYRVVESDSAMGYIVDHSSYTYIIDKQGKLRHTLVHGTAPEEILTVVRELLAES